MIRKDIYDYPFDEVDFYEDSLNDESCEYYFFYSKGKHNHILSGFNRWLTCGGRNFIIDCKNQIIYCREEQFDSIKRFWKRLYCEWGI